MGNVLFSIIWLLVLIFIGFAVAGFAAGFYILFLPFTVCISGLSVRKLGTSLSPFQYFYTRWILSKKWVL